MVDLLCAWLPPVRSRDRPSRAPAGTDGAGAGRVATEDEFQSATSASDESLRPVEGPGDGLLPERVLVVDLGLVHLRSPFLVLAPVLAKVLHLCPESDREAGGIGGAQRGGLGDG